MLAQRIAHWRIETSGQFRTSDAIPLSLAAQCVVAAWLHADPNALRLVGGTNATAIENSLNAFLGALCHLTTGKTLSIAETSTTNPK